MYKLIKDGCPNGYGYVQDYMGNKVYYGPVKACKDCIRELNKTGKRGKRK